MAEDIPIRVQSSDATKKTLYTTRETTSYTTTNTLSLLRIKHGSVLFLLPEGSFTSSGKEINTATPHTSSSLSSSELFWLQDGNLHRIRQVFLMLLSSFDSHTWIVSTRCG
uniref:Uncharacterized protein n=1 Tax=Stegastes partitus TaxID=144197 RepID=A0A3B5A3E1_9TELE